jgi:flagellar motor switch protein FliG
MEDKIKGPQKAAIFLYGLGEEMASEIIKNLSDEEVQKLGSSMAKVYSIAPKTVEAVFTEFQHLATSDRIMQVNAIGRSQFIKNIFSRALSGEKAQNILDKIEEEEKFNLFRKVREIDSKTLANLIRNEHPQTIAIVLVHLESTQAAAILAELPARAQADILYRITQLESVPPGILEEIDRTLQEELALLENFEGKQLGGLRSVAEILNHFDNAAENSLLDNIDEQKKGLADEIRRLMFVFEDLIHVDDRSIMAILKEINSDALKLAMKTASEELKEKLFRNMSERAAEMMKEDLEIMGPVRLRDVEAAQQAIIRSAKKLEGEGKIMLTAKGKEEVFV